MKKFWQDLPVPFTILAPMDGVTDVVFRQIIAQIGRPHVFFTEFANTDGLVSKGKDRVLERLRLAENEHPIVAQIWGTNPEHFRQSAKIAVELGFDGIDINLGCPDKTIMKKGACAALIKNHTLTAEIIQATKSGAGTVPVSVKTRMGYAEEDIDVWIAFLLEQNIAALTIHLRTVKELSLVPAHWNLMPKIMDLKRELAPETVIIGNGDISSLGEVEKKYREYHCDGFMIGRGIFKNPWLFNKSIDIEKVTVAERFKLYLQHVNEFERRAHHKNFALLKKFCKTYINNFESVHNVREKIMETKTIEELKKVLTENLHLAR